MWPALFALKSERSLIAAIWLILRFRNVSRRALNPCDCYVSFYPGSVGAAVQAHVPASAGRAVGTSRFF